MASNDQNLPPIPAYPKDESRRKSAGLGALDIATEIVATSLPGVAGVKNVLVEKLVRAPLEKRRAEFHERVAEGLAQLEARLDGFDPSELEENESFISAVYEATQAAMRSSADEKRKYLVNAVLNVAAGFTLDDVIQASFVQIIGRFSGQHVAVLKAYQNPASLGHLFPQSNANVNAPMKDLLARALIPKGVSQDALDRVHDDLDNERMIAVYAVQGSIGANGSLLTPIGEKFLRFISSPIEFD
ncbi:hypothetical protein ACU8MX_14835 [Rhizobium leguminosarum]